MACQAQRSNKRTKTIVPPEGEKFLKVTCILNMTAIQVQRLHLKKLNITLGVQRFVKCFEDECVNYS